MGVSVSTIAAIQVQGLDCPGNNQCYLTVQGPEACDGCLWYVYIAMFVLAKA